MSVPPAWDFLRQFTAGRIGLEDNPTGRSGRSRIQFLLELTYCLPQAHSKLDFGVFGGREGEASALPAAGTFECRFWGYWRKNAVPAASTFEEAYIQ